MYKPRSHERFAHVAAIVAGTSETERMNRAWWAARDVAARHATGRMTLLFVACVTNGVGDDGIARLDVELLAAQAGLTVDAAAKGLEDLCETGFLLVRGKGRRRDITFPFAERRPIITAATRKRSSRAQPVVAASESPVHH